VSALAQGLEDLIEIGCTVALVAVIVAVTSGSRVDVSDVRRQVVNAVRRAHVGMHEVATIGRMCLAAIHTALMNGSKQS
jgi:hypothetical protein